MSADWIAADWSGGVLVAVGIGPGGAVLWQSECAGASTEAALAELPEQAPAIVSGPAPEGGRALRGVPAKPLDTAPTRTGDAHVLKGLTQAEPVAAMEGPEVRIAGFQAFNPKFDGILCLPGADATYWAEVSAGEVVSFRTALTGRLAEAVSGESGPLFGDAFEAALDATLSRPERLAETLGSAAARLRTGADGAADMALGALIGAELAAARPYWLGQEVAVIGKGDAARAYVAALERQGTPATIADPDAMWLRGMNEARRSLA
ncbi:2-dehydro-3-deoxygalactonokinase [Roseicyclus sp. F158]|uniref:2-dehydro-3-deoxygalactonokinase n=1 Tax=Tropicimonas omnivorans TaxID=3075590 RepID=A0ABU3DD97_9RHOB|nr:2-dehydro-3-deoxygalactonokinase [Roseicyclus sp. F158]MDT0681645.1 2-dehydro-3-deoxygalactonokinase [Roseicyclus sp. F158]